MKKLMLLLLALTLLNCSQKNELNDDSEIEKILNVDFIEKDSDNSSILVIAGGIASFLVMASALAWLITRRRKRLADIDLIDSWGVFGGEQKEYDEEELEN